MTQQKIIACYLRQVKQNCPFFIRRKQASALANDLTEYLEAHPGGTLEDVVHHFGTPEKYADAYYIAMEEPKRRKAIRSARRIKCACIVTAATLILCAAAISVYTLYFMSEDMVIYIEEGVEYNTQKPIIENNN